MSKIALISDIHANLPALESVLADSVQQGAERHVCLGDVVGYGPNPSECVTRIQDLGCICIKGNHDEYISYNDEVNNFNELAKAALTWTKSQLSISQKDWLASLPYTRRLGRQMLVHASINNPEGWEYVRNSFDASIAMNAQNTDMCFSGHTHVPIVYEMNGGKVTVKDTAEIIKLDAGCKYLVNCGSVGQPRDGNPLACYVLFDRSERTLEFRRVAYDVEAVAAEIRAAGLPEKLAARLVDAY